MFRRTLTDSLKTSARATFSKASKFSTEVPPKAAPKGMFGRGMAFVSRNRQQFINIAGVYFVFMFSLYNYKVRIAWDELENKKNDLEDRLDRIEESLYDPKWLADTEAKIVKAKSVSGSVLLESLNAVVAEEEEDEVSKTKKEIKKFSKGGDKDSPAEEEELSKLIPEVKGKVF